MKHINYLKKGYPMPSPFAAHDSALLLIDHQVGTMQLIKNIDQAQAAQMTLALAKAAKILGMPVVMTSSQEGHAQGPLMPELQDILPEAFAQRVQRAGIVNAWTDSNFRNAVLATGRKNIIMAGVTTDVCLVYPSISAVEEGFRVQAVMDASGSPFELSEDMSRRRMEKAGVVLTATNTMIAELAQDWSTPAGQQLIALLFTSVLPPITAA
jgi:nicotinamidase-related amidase